MSQPILLLLALSPVVLIPVLVLWCRRPAHHALAGGLALTVILAGFAWQTPWSYIAAASLQGMVTALDIMLICFF